MGSDVELTLLHADHEGMPLRTAEDQDGALRVLGVTDRDPIPHHRNFDTSPYTAPLALAPLNA